MLPFVSYLIQMDREKWDAFKRRIKAEGRTVKWVIEAMFDQYIRRGLDESQPEKKDDKK